MFLSAGFVLLTVMHQMIFFRFLFCFVFLNYSSSEQGHVGPPFTNEEQKSSAGNATYTSAIHAGLSKPDTIAALAIMFSGLSNINF